MALWDKVKQGIDKAGKAAQDVFDEGKLRLDAYRAREQADKAAEALGYAVFRALEAGSELDAEARTRLMDSLRAKDAEARRMETDLANAKAAAAASAGEPVVQTPAAEPAAPSSPPPTTDQQNGGYGSPM
ncbi:MAG TPA: hypothetical protein VGE27_16315 [Gemmatimonas sp.]|uniref:hypothetical protein n=1 Tax=Gemmatimonas sp. TaxID=1962908 RepID=UPI002EDAC8E7